MLRKATEIALAAGLLAIGVAQAQQLSPAASPPPPAYGPPVTADQAKKAVAAALADGKTRPYLLVFAVVDPSGNLVYFERMDGAPYASNDVAIHKARPLPRSNVPPWLSLSRWKGVTTTS